IADYPDPVGPDRGTNWNRESLFGDGMAIFEPGKADVTRRNLRQPAQLLGDPLRICTALADREQPVIAVAVGRKAQPFANNEVLGRDANATAGRRHAIGTGKLGNSVKQCIAQNRGNSIKYVQSSTFNQGDRMTAEPFLPTNEAHGFTG